MHQNPSGSAPDAGGGAYDAPPDSYSAGEGTLRAEIPILWVFQLSVSPPKEAETSQAYQQNIAVLLLLVKLFCFFKEYILTVLAFHGE